MLKKWISNSSIALTILFFYTPIFILITFSFNSLKSSTVFGGVSLQWYERMFADGDLMKALYYTIFTAIVATIVATILGTLSAIGLSKSRPIIKSYVKNINDLPVLNPEIVTAISLMLLFITLNLDRGLLTLIIAHIAFCTPYVMIAVYPKVRGLDPNLTDAAMDLGATPRQALTKVILPQLQTSILAGALIAFTMSFDDFVISYFVTGNGVQNISMFVYNASKRINPSLNALFTVMFIVISILIVTVNLVIPSFNKRKAKRKVVSKKEKKRAHILKISLTAMLSIALFFTVTKLVTPDTRPVLRVFNWGEYIDKTVIHQFEETYDIRVIYETFDTNESMYTKLLSGSVYDVIVPSDYMIERLVDENLIQPLDWSLIPNAEGLNENSLGLDFDPEAKYAAPYLYGTVGIIYNKDTVDTKDLEAGWDILRNPTYKNRVFMYNSVRDGFMIPLKALGYSLNTESPDEIEAAYNWLVDQKKEMNPVYLIDTVIDQMKAGEKDLAVVYSGDANEIIAENENMAYYIPHQGTNFWMDGMVIPKTTTGDSLTHAHMFINFMLDPEIAYLNTVEVGYSSPVTQAYELAIEEEFYGIGSYIMPEMSDLDESYINQIDVIKKLFDELWTKFLAS